MRNNDHILTKKEYYVALVGTPNSGKTTLFNALTGSRARTGNFTGVTVSTSMARYRCKWCDKKIGMLSNKRIKIVDLPGIITYETMSQDLMDRDRAEANEADVTVDFISNKQADLIINIIDANHLLRDLYLTIQLIELNVPLLIVVNKIDVARKRHTRINLEMLKNVLNAHAVCVNAHKIDDIRTLACEINYLLNAQRIERDKVSDNNILHKIYPHNELETKLHNEANAPLLIAGYRYAYIYNYCRNIVQKKTTKQNRNITKVIDSLVMHKILAYPILICVLCCLFLLSFSCGNAIGEIVSNYTRNTILTLIKSTLTSIHAPKFIVMLVCDGIGSGVIAILTFIPLIAIFYFIFLWLNESGYIARVVIITEKLMLLIKLPGNAIIPLLTGFGCNVPAIMMARTISGRKQRIATIMMLPYISCNARMTVSALFIGAIFPQYAGCVIVTLYAISIIVTLIVGVICKYLLKIKCPLISRNAVMTLPVYSWPHLYTIILQTWSEILQFLKSIGTIVVATSCILGIFGGINFVDGSLKTTSIQNSILVQVGKKIHTIFKPIGLSEDNWQASVSLIPGIFAKELIIGSLGTLYGIDNRERRHEEKLNSGEVVEYNASNDISDSIRTYFTNGASALGYVTFVLLYFPCISVFAAIAREIGWRYAITAGIMANIIAYIVAFVVYRIGSIFL